MKELKKVVYFISFPLGFIGFIFPIYASSLGVNIMEIGYLFSVFSIVGIIIRPAIGKLIDKKGRKIGIITGTILYASVNIFFMIAGNFRYLLFARILQSIASSFLWISADTFISDVSDKTNRSINFGIIDQSSAKGGFLGNFIGFIVVYSNFFGNPFKLLFALFFCTSLISFYYGLRKVPETIDFKKDIEEGKLIDRRGLIFFTIIMGIISLISNLTAPIYLVYLQENITSDLGLISTIFIPASILSTFLPKRFGMFSDKYGREKTIILGLIISGILQILIPFNKSYYSFTIIYTIISVAGMFYGPALSSIIIDFVGENRRGKSYGLYSFASGVGATIGPIVGSYIYENVGNDTIFHLKGAALIALTLFIWYIYITRFNLNREERLFRSS